MNPTSATYGPLSGQDEVDDTVAALRAAGVRRRSLGVVDLQPRRPGVERDPLASWALSAIWRETLRIFALSLPVLVGVNVALLLPTLPDQPAVAAGIGVAAGVGLSPVAAVVGFALAWSRWGHLADQHHQAPATSGYVVVVARGSRP
jgi:hypothetical protein